MNEIVRLISYNTTELDTILLNWINELLDTFYLELGQLQEHFKTIRKVDSYFKQNFKKYDSYAIPAIQENVNHLGRPKGGLAQMGKKQGNMNKSETHYKGDRQEFNINVLNAPTDSFMLFVSFS